MAQAGPGLLWDAPGVVRSAFKQSRALSRWVFVVLLSLSPEVTALTCAKWDDGFLW